MATHHGAPAVLYFGNDWRAENRTSSHHVARQLVAAGYRVYYVEVPGLRAPGRSGRDLKKIGAKVWSFVRGLRREGDRLAVRTILQVPLLRYAAVRQFNRAFVLAGLRWMMWREGIKRPVAWFVVPHLGFLVGRLGEQASVYYCVDDFASYPGLDPKSVRALDEELTRKVDVVFVTSETLVGPKQGLNPNTFASPHGVDVGHFSRAQDPGLAVPDDVAALPHPVVGYFGLIDGRVDTGLVDDLAARRPDWSFVLIGRVAVPEGEVPRRPNVHLLGPRPYESLAAYGKAFDVALIPYRPLQVNYHANPLKLREYLAMGKPVVSLDIPAAAEYGDLVGLARTPDEFLDRLDEALSHPPAAAEARARVARVAPLSWEARLRAVLGTVQRVTGAPLGPD